MKTNFGCIFAVPIAKVAQLVEHNLAKVGVAGSNPVFRSKTLQQRRVFCWSPGGGIGRHAGLKILWTAMSVPVRPRPGAPEARLLEAGFFVHFSVENP